MLTEGSFLNFEALTNFLLRKIVARDDTMYFAIGDVHGCAIEFNMMLDEIEYYAQSKGKAPHIFQLGDLIDRGPCLSEVFSLIYEYNVTPILGNHELNFILERYGHKKCRSKVRRETHDRFDDLPQFQQDSYLGIMERMATYQIIELGQTTFILSHAPVKGIETLKFSSVTAWSHCSRNTPYEFENKSLANQVFIHGHQHWNYKEIGDVSLDDAKDHGLALNIDGGVVYGEELVGVCLNDLQQFKVKAKAKYCE